MDLTILRNIILAVGWPVLILGSIYLFVKGRVVYSLVKNSMVGRITKILVYTMLIEMYSLGIVCTAYMFRESKGVFLVFPVFLIWFIVFVLSLKTLIKVGEEAKKLADIK